jgi:hypothetical protein
MTFVEAEAYCQGPRSGWRLPTMAELLSIVEKRCRNPAIDSETFPGVVELNEGQAKYWSQTPFREMPGLFLNVDFMDGSTDANTRGIAMGVRLVRDDRK